MPLHLLLEVDKITLVESVMDWLQTCPELSGGELNLDWLPPEARSYSVIVIPCDETVKKYTTGATKKKFLFYVASREFLSDDVRDAQGNYQFYEAFSEWVEQQNLIGNLPDLGERRKVTSVRVTTSGYPLQVSPDKKAVYQIQLRMDYKQ